MPSSTTKSLSRQPLTRVPADVADPRDPRGVRHDLPTILSLGNIGVLAGCRSLTAIWEHTTDLEAAQLAAMGLEPGAVLPSESTIRRVLAGLDAAGLDARIRSWTAIRTGTVQGRRLIAVDGRTMRGARSGDQTAAHLLAALDHATGTVLTQRKVPGRSNEIPALKELLEPLDLDGAVITADAMHTQAATAAWITQQGAHYVLTVKANQPKLRDALRAWSVDCRACLGQP